MSETSALDRYRQLCAELDRRLFAEAMDLDCRLSALESGEDDSPEYNFSLTDHGANLRLIEERLDRLEKKLLPQPKPN